MCWCRCCTIFLIGTVNTISVSVTNELLRDATTRGVTLEIEFRTWRARGDTSLLVRAVDTIAMLVTDFGGVDTLAIDLALVFVGALTVRGGA